VVTVEAFRQFDLIFSMTGGGPGTVTKILPLKIFEFNFRFSQYGLASAASYILIIIATILAVAYFVVLTQRKVQTRKIIEKPAVA
jgi:ABC-type sugar transport system permease subunit